MYMREGDYEGRVSCWAPVERVTVKGAGEGGAEEARGGGQDKLRKPNESA